MRGQETLDRESVQTYLAETPVTYAVLFGSHARGAASSQSDVDICLRFPDDLSRLDRFRRRNRIDAELQSYAGTFVDVSDVETLPDEVALTALEEGEILYQ